MPAIKLESIRALVEPLLSIKDRWASDLRTALDRTQTNIERLNTKVGELESRLNILSPFASGPRLVIKHFFITGDFIIPLPDEPAGTVLLYVVEQDSTGIHTVTFPNPPFIGTYPNAVALEAGSITSMAFFKTGTDLKPVLTAMALTET